MVWRYWRNSGTSRMTCGRLCGTRASLVKEAMEFVKRRLCILCVEVLMHLGLFMGMRGVEWRSAGEWNLGGIISKVKQTKPAAKHHIPSLFILKELLALTGSEMSTMRRKLTSIGKILKVLVS